MTQVNKSYHYAMNCFTKACQEQIGIKPLDDDRLVLKAAVDFEAYIKTFKRLDHSVNWHQHFISTMITLRVDTLSKCINKEYGTHKKYIDRVR